MIRWSGCGGAADESDVGRTIVTRVARFSIVGTLALTGCLTVAPPGFVRTGEHAFYRGWFDVNTLDAPALYFERVEHLPYCDERVKTYPRMDRRAPGPRLALETHQQGVLVPFRAESGSPAADAPAPPASAPTLSEPELLPPPPAP
jgi:hypothetical protein